MLSATFPVYADYIRVLLARSSNVSESKAACSKWNQPQYKEKHYRKLKTLPFMVLVKMFFDPESSLPLLKLEIKLPPTHPITLKYSLQSCNCPKLDDSSEILLVTSPFTGNLMIIRLSRWIVFLRTASQSTTGGASCLGDIKEGEATEQRLFIEHDHGRNHLRSFDHLRVCTKQASSTKFPSRHKRHRLE